MTRRGRGDDRGTSLVIVLMIVTVVSLVIGVILAQEDTSVKATEVLQDQSATNYGADAAGQAAVTQLENGQFACTTPAPSTLNLGNGPSTPFYSPIGAASGPENAVATCTPDTTTGVTPTVTGIGTMVGAANTPSASLTTVGTSIVDGVLAAGGPPSFSICVQGSVVSYTTITGILSAGQNTNGSATACPNAATSTVTVQAYGSPIANLIVPGTGCALGAFPVTPCSGLGSTVPAVPTVPDPVVTSTTTNPPAICLNAGTNKVYAAFVPGVYNQSPTATGSLNAPCKINGKWVTPNVDWFSPGTYYFNFGATTWTLPAAVVGGTPATAAGQPISGLSPTTASTLSNLAQMSTGEGKCIPPTAQTQANEGGVEFVFGGASTMTGMAPSVSVSFPSLKTVVGPSTDLDLCATYSPTSPPVAIYGVQHTLTVGAGASATTIAVESGCVASPLCAIGSNSILNWPTALAVLSPDQTFHIDGYVWAPAAGMIITYANSNGQAFNWGVLVRSFQLIGQNSLTMVRVPPPSPGQVTSYSYSVRYVSVWTCVASGSPCPQTGPPDVQIKLLQTGSTWKVLSWSEQR